VCVLDNAGGGKTVQGQDCRSGGGRAGLGGGGGEGETLKSSIAPIRNGSKTEGGREGGRAGEREDGTEGGERDGGSERVVMPA
jgi:hypothetical protein